MNESDVERHNSIVFEFRAVLRLLLKSPELGYISEAEEVIKDILKGE